MKNRAESADMPNADVPSEKEAQVLGMNAEVTRRDFVGSSLLGAGASLLGMASPISAAPKGYGPGQSALPMTGLGPDWTGPGGIGDYQLANADTHLEVNAAHAGVRNREFDPKFLGAEDTGEELDLVIVGSGCAGLGAAYQYNKERPEGKVLVLENHAIFGGDARRNEIEVDGTLLFGQQGPTAYRMSNSLGFGTESSEEFARELGLPDTVEFANPTGLKDPNLRIPYDEWTPLAGDKEQSDCGYFFGSTLVRNPWRNGFRDAPISSKLRDDLATVTQAVEPPFMPEGDVDKWLDSMTYLDLLTKVFKVDPGVLDYTQEGLVVGATGLGGDVYSALTAKHLNLAGARAYNSIWTPDYFKDVHAIEAPGGNAAMARTLVSKLIPGAFQGSSWTDIWLRPLKWDALDGANQNVRIRHGCTVLSVVHDGPPESAGSVIITYARDGRLYRARAKTVIVSTPQQIGKRICQDIPRAYRTAMNEFHQAPVLIVNVALRNWRFLEALGISSARWMEGFGYWASIRRQLKVDGSAQMPCDPNKPVMLSLYVPFNIPGVPYPQQATAARMQMFGMSFASIERKVRQQLTFLFGSSGFDAKRDIAGIIANRQGHALVTSPPGTFYGKDGRPPRADIIQTRFNRLAFAHSDLNGGQDWHGAVAQGRRAANQVLEVA